MATHSSILPWGMSWTEEAGELQSIGSHRAWRNWRDVAHMHRVRGPRWKRFCLNGILYVQEVHNLPGGGLVASLSPVQLCATPRTIAHQVPLSMGISTQEFWSGLTFPSPRDIPDPRIKPYLLHISLFYVWELWEVVQFSHSVDFDSLRPHGVQHTRLPCPSPTPRAYSNSCPSSQGCHPTISSTVVPFSSCLQSFLASGSFQWVSSSNQVARVLEFQLQHQSFQWIFRTDFL